MKFNSSTLLGLAIAGGLGLFAISSFKSGSGGDGATQAKETFSVITTPIQAGAEKAVSTLAGGIDLSPINKSIDVGSKYLLDTVKNVTDGFVNLVPNFNGNDTSAQTIPPLIPVSSPTYTDTVVHARNNLQDVIEKGRAIPDDQYPLGGFGKSVLLAGTQFTKDFTLGLAQIASFIPSGISRIADAGANINILGWNPFRTGSITN